MTIDYYGQDEYTIEDDYDSSHSPTPAAELASMELPAGVKEALVAAYEKLDAGDASANKDLKAATELLREAREASEPSREDVAREQIRTSVWAHVQAGRFDQAEESIARLVRSLRRRDSAGPRAAYRRRVIADGWNDRAERLVPTILERGDGKFTFYPGRTHSVSGEPGSGKSMLMQYACLEVLRSSPDAVVLYVDFEDSYEGIVGRMQDLGGTEEECRRLQYIELDLGQLHEAMFALMEDAIELRPTLLVFDGQAEAMAAAGWDENSNQDATAFSAIVLKPVAAETGAAVVAIDHLGKQVMQAGATPSNYARGASAKLAAITGAAYVLRTIRAFSQEQEGSASLIVAKDRHGTYAKGSTVSLVTYVPTAGDGIRVSMTVPTGDAGRPTHKMQLASEILERAGTEGMGKTLLVDEVGGKKDYSIIAVNTLLAEGYAVMEKVGRTQLVKHVKPYRELDEATRPAGSESKGENPWI